MRIPRLTVCAAFAASAVVAGPALVGDGPGERRAGFVAAGPTTGPGPRPTPRRTSDVDTTGSAGLVVVGGAAVVVVGRTLCLRRRKRGGGDAD